MMKQANKINYRGKNWLKNSHNMSWLKKRRWWSPSSITILEIHTSSSKMGSKLTTWSSTEKNTELKWPQSISWLNPSSRIVWIKENTKYLMSTFTIASFENSKSFQNFSIRIHSKELFFIPIAKVRQRRFWIILKESGYQTRRCR